MSTVLGQLESRAARVAAACGSTTVISIDGRAGSGKSTLGALLAQRLGSALVHMEDLYPHWGGLAEGADSLVTEVLEPLSRSAAAHVPQHDWVLDRWSEPVVLEPPRILVVEGAGSGSLRAAPYLSLLVWLECDEQTRRQRALARQHDGAAFALEWGAWAAQEEALMARDRTPMRADLVIDTTAEGVEHSRLLTPTSGERDAS